MTPVEMSAVITINTDVHNSNSSLDERLLADTDLSLGSLLALYRCISATIRSRWFPNSFFSALRRATSEALGPFSVSVTFFRLDSICCNTNVFRSFPQSESMFDLDISNLLYI